MSSVAVVLGLVIVIGSLFANVLQGVQIALIGIGFILIGIFLAIPEEKQQ